MTQHLSDHSLRQLSPEYLGGLGNGELLNVSTSLLHDLKEARERLNQSSDNSSRPPSTHAPWEKTKKAAEPLEADTVDQLEKGNEPAAKSQQPKSEAAPTSTSGNDAASPPIGKRKPGKQFDAPGYGRTWCPRIDATVHHSSACCAACRAVFDEHTRHTAYTAYDSVDIQWGTPETPGVTVHVTRTHLNDSHCACGHITRATPHCQRDTLYPKVEVSEWRLIGPNLASLVVHLRLRWRLSVRKTQEILREVMGIPLSIGVLQQCNEQAAVGAAPLEDKLVEDLFADTVADLCAAESAPAEENALSAVPLAPPFPSGAVGIMHLDESPWREGGVLLWLWVFITRHTACYWIGYRTREILDNVLPRDFKGWVMTDGYQAYRSFPNRLRCWAHLLRKTKGLIECLDIEGQAFGFQVRQLMGDLKNDIIEWRKIHPDQHVRTDDIANNFADRLNRFRKQCLMASKSEHEKTAALAKEFLNDWDAIFRVLLYPAFPLTNNEAERALRHWVLLRRISHGTKTDVGSRSLALLASVIDTCRLRSASSLDYLSDVIRAARSGATLPPLPARVGV